MSKQEKEPLFSAKNMKFLTGPFSANNPVIVQILGICSALAVTVQLKPAIVMALSVTVVTGFSNLVMSLLRNGVPSRIRIIVQLVVIAALVILVDQVLKAFVFEVSKQLSVYVGLIITNCIIMGRVEAYALGNKPLDSFLDGIGNGLGYAAILLIIAFFRELFGSGQIFGMQVIPESWYIANGGFYSNIGLMLFPPMALIIVGVMLADGNLLQIVTEKRAYVISLIRNLICPLIMLVVMALLPLDPNLRMAVLIYVACPVANLTSVYAIQHDMEPALCARATLLSTILFAATIPFIIWLGQLVYGV